MSMTLKRRDADPSWKESVEALLANDCGVSAPAATRARPSRSSEAWILELESSHARIEASTPRAPRMRSKATTSKPVPQPPQRTEE